MMRYHDVKDMCDADRESCQDNAAECGFVDTELSAESAAALNRIGLAMLQSTQRRVVASFCGQENYEWVRKSRVRPIGMMMMECLARFVHHNNGEIVFAARIRDNFLSTIQHSVCIDGQPRHILLEGTVFIRLPRNHIVVSVDPERDSLQIDVRADDGAALFWQQWEEFCRQDNYVRGRALFADGELIERRRKYTWDSIVLPEQARRTIETHVTMFLNNRLQLQELGVKSRRGLILSGPPGTGKTLLGKILADTLDTSFIWVTPRHVQSAYSFAGILDMARFVAPAVLFLEDLDLFAGDRDSAGWTGLGELMNQLDGAADNHDIVTIATTNRLEVVEKALRNRPGRFDRVVELGHMADVSRRTMLQKVLSKVKVDDKALDLLVEASGKYTGAQVEELANTVLILALQRRSNGSNGDYVIDSTLAADAVAEFQVELKTKVGFGAA